MCEGINNKKIFILLALLLLEELFILFYNHLLLYSISIYSC